MYVGWYGVCAANGFTSNSGIAGERSTEKKPGNSYMNQPTVTIQSTNSFGDNHQNEDEISSRTSKHEDLINHNGDSTQAPDTSVFSRKGQYKPQEQTSRGTMFFSAWRSLGAPLRHVKPRFTQQESSLGVSGWSAWRWMSAVLCCVVHLSWMTEILMTPNCRDMWYNP